jgi:hypothetical protein
MAPRTRKLTEPLETMTFIFGMVIALLVGLGVTSALLSHSASFAGLGNATICATDTNVTIGTAQPQPGPSQFTAKPGASLNFDSHPQACTSHNGVGVRLLYSLTTLPNLVLFAAVLLLLWRVIRLARREGPFSPRIAPMLRHLGWLVIAGTVAATAIQNLASHLLLNTMLAPSESWGGAVGWVEDLIVSPLLVLLPWRIIVAGALLTFARVMRVGAAMEEEIKAVV